MRNKIIHTYTIYIINNYIVKCIIGVLYCIKVYFFVSVNTVNRCIEIIRFNTPLIQDNEQTFNTLTLKCII